MERPIRAQLGEKGNLAAGASLHHSGEPYPTQQRHMEISPLSSGRQLEHADLISFGDDLITPGNLTVD
ncbi:MAG: hypothetical protein R6U38_04810 [Desulfatiglandaceae bacterium]